MNEIKALGGYVICRQDGDSEFYIYYDDSQRYVKGRELIRTGSVERAEAIISSLNSGELILYTELRYAVPEAKQASQALNKCGDTGSSGICPVPQQHPMQIDS